MRFLIIFSMFILGNLSSAYSQDDCPCCSGAYKQFDYWEGSWVVYDTTGKKVGTNKIIKMHDGCLLQENWVSTGKHAGTSYNFYNKADDSWNQIWIDNQGMVLDLKGRLENGVMALRSAEVKNDKGETVYHRIKWIRQSDGSVRQVWDIVRREGGVDTNLFTGIYKKEE